MSHIEVRGPSPACSEGFHHSVGLDPVSDSALHQRRNRPAPSFRISGGAGGPMEPTDRQHRSKMVLNID